MVHLRFSLMLSINFVILRMGNLYLSGQVVSIIEPTKHEQWLSFQGSVLTIDTKDTLSTRKLKFDWLEWIWCWECFGNISVLFSQSSSVTSLDLSVSLWPAYLFSLYRGINRHRVHSALPWCSFPDCACHCTALMPGPLLMRQTFRHICNIFHWSELSLGRHQQCSFWGYCPVRRADSYPATRTHFLLIHETTLVKS